MLTCECGKKFHSYRQLNGHKSSHNRTRTYKIGRSKKVEEKYICKHCGNEAIAGRTKTNIFCSSQCMADWTWLNVSVPKIERGECNHSSARLLKKYLKWKVGDFCVECGITSMWNKKELVLQIDHIDGNAGNNLPKNLRLVCPNCHSQTSTFVARNKGNGRQARGLKR